MQAGIVTNAAVVVDSWPLSIYVAFAHAKRSLSCISTKGGVTATSSTFTIIMFLSPSACFKRVD